MVIVWSVEMEHLLLLIHIIVNVKYFHCFQIPECPNGLTPTEVLDEPGRLMNSRLTTSPESDSNDLRPDEKGWKTPVVSETSGKDAPYIEVKLADKTHKKPIVSEVGVLGNVATIRIEIMEKKGGDYKLLTKTDGSKDFEVKVLFYFATSVYTALIVGRFGYVVSGNRKKNEEPAKLKRDVALRAL
jgi:hypothetical protein